jgi:hypothetical protein
MFAVLSYELKILKYAVFWPPGFYISFFFDVGLMRDITSQISLQDLNQVSPKYKSEAFALEPTRITNAEFLFRV